MGYVHACKHKEKDTRVCQNIWYITYIILQILNKVLTSTFIPHVLWDTSTLKDYSKYTQLHV